MPFDVREILKYLDEGHHPDAGPPRWLRESWEDPEGFFVALRAAHAGRSAVQPKSQPGQHYDLFHDLVLRHFDSDRVALRAYDKLRGWQTLSYRQLHDRASRRSAEWAEQGVKPGAKVCLIYNVGVEQVISLLAALQLGACVSLLPTRGMSFVPHRLEILQPDHIAAEPHQVPLFEGFEKLLLRGRGVATPRFSSHVYEPDEPVGLLFSPLADPPDTPVPLTAAQAWQGALCDGMLTFGLGVGDHLAAPGLHFLQHQPALLFAALLRGATFLHLELEDLERDPTPLYTHPIHTMGVCPELREILLKSRSGSLAKVSLWFRSPEEPLDWKSWRDWVRQCELTEAQHANVLIDAAAGGMVVGSLRRVGDIHVDASPAPGRTWTLKDINMSGQEAPGDVGVFTLLPDEERPPGHVVLSRVRDQHLYAATRDVRREGRVYPAAEVVTALQDMPFSAGASVFPVPTGGLQGHSYVLLVFTGAELPAVTAREAGTRREQIRQHLELQLGAEYLPDRIEFFPLYPRMAKKGLDDAWCRSQYETGALHRKSNHPIFRAITGVRGRLLESEARSGDDARDRMTG
ncbi:AMP-binding protein [Hyalangium rubrum]|uniref:AMP-binding protein n=1 Tax=Hyalangium rubrum TaxID=3103134 RepID=A0ABU5HHW3_9BACT|nr:AMP-binding protein [Hyalangium sp. s54d21]MDY7233063.1 AMP-binding protein [Hyalangium sp. s54d21]